MIKIQPVSIDVFQAALLAAFFLLLVSTANTARANTGWGIEYAESARIDSQVLPSNAGAENQTVRLSVSAFNNNYSLMLESNNHLISGLINLDVPKDVVLYRGKVEGRIDSWVRLTYYAGQYIGAIFDGSELFLLDTRENLSKVLRHTLNSAANNSPVMYKATDIRSSMTCGIHAHGANKFSYQKLVSQLRHTVVGKKQQMTAASSGTLEQIKLDIVADTEYSREVSGSTTSAIVSQMNVVDGIFTEQVGVTIAINDMEILSNNGSLTSRNSESLLNSFRDYAGRSHPGIAHLFTGKDLDGGSTLGIAYLDAICSNWGVGVSQAGGRGVGGALTVAHELGHNFGAPHDNQGGSECSYESNRYLMNPYYNQSDQFSQCSISQMNSVINNASCLVEVDDDGTGGGGNTDALTTSKLNYTLGEPAVINYSDGSGSNLDWVGIFRQGDLTSSCRQNDSYVDWVYTNGRSGTVSFDGLAVGRYDAQLFSDDGYCYIGNSVSFAVVEDSSDVPASDLPYKGFKDESELCLSVDNSRAPMRVKVSPCSFGLLDNNQRWRLTEARLIQSLSTGLCLTPGSTLSSQAEPFLAQCTVEPWFLWNHQNGVLINEHNPNYALTSLNAPGAIVRMSTQNGSVNQQWAFGGALGMSGFGLIMLLFARIRFRP